MEKKLSSAVSVYKKHLEAGDIQIAYESLLKYMMSLKAHCEKTLSDLYSFGNVSPGYMDFTYFSFFNSYLRSKKLRFGIVLNHRDMRFELWLMGQNAEIQKKYWELLKDSTWNQHRATMPKYSVLEAVLIESPDFDDLNTLTAKIEKAAFSVSNEVLDHVKTMDSFDSQ